MVVVCREAGLAEPVFEELGTRFRVTLHTARTGAPTVDPMDGAILDALAGGEGHFALEIAAAIGRTPARYTHSSGQARGAWARARVGSSLQAPKRR